MSDSVVTAAASTVEDAISQLKDQLAVICEHPEAAVEGLRGKKVLRLEVPLAGTDPLVWIQTNSGEWKQYWRDRQDGTETAAVGIAERLILGEEGSVESLIDCARERLCDVSESVRFWGGFRFDTGAKQIDNCWRPFERGQLVLPRIELRRDANGGGLACNLLREEIAGLDESMYTEWFADSDARGDHDEIRGIIDTKRVDFPAKEEWLENVSAIIEAISDGLCDKLVLSRKSSVTLNRSVACWDLLMRLRQNSQKCFLFGISPDSVSSFVGATPEQLYYRNGRKIHTEAIAGTRPRGSDDNHDHSLATDLLSSEKDHREHDLVIQGIESTLGPLCGHLSQSGDSTLLRLSRVQHLMTRFSGSLRSGIRDGEILTALHPTPAVGGSPVEGSIEMIQRFEPFDRGWYAGPVGWISPCSAQFAVALRCALVSSDNLSLFSGAGIVAGSSAEEEWGEIEDKIGNFLTVVGL